MALKTSTLRPGLLVSLKTSVRGNVSYTKRMLESERRTRDGAAKAKWETERTTADPVENEAAHAARGKARTVIASVCAWSAFGYLCPEDRINELEQAIAGARKIADDFNQNASITRLNVHVITGRIAPDDVEAVRAINSEVRDLMEQMAEGVQRLDVKSIRDAANKARGLGQMLTPEAEARVKIAIETARSTARKIVKAGEQAAQEIDKSAMRRITEQRTAFLDFDETPQEVRAPKARGRALDLAPATE